jgi:glycosyltransferase involved in cell wall biosynthesis
MSPDSPGLEASRLSVVIPAFNAQSTIEAAIRSAEACGVTEIIVIDDGSSDRTSTLAEDLGAIVTSVPNGGAAAARRLGVAQATRPIVIFLDADDVLIDDGVRESVRAIEGDPEVVAVLGAIKAIRSDGTSKSSRPWESPLTTERLLRSGYAPVPPAAIAWRREAAVSAMNSSYPPGLWLDYAEDYELLIRGTLLGVVLIHGKQAAAYRVFGGKSFHAPVEEAQAARAVVVHYGHVAGIELPKRTDRSARAQAMIRVGTTRSGGIKSPVNWLSIFGALIVDPRSTSSWLRSAVGRSRRRRDSASD